MNQKTWPSPSDRPNFSALPLAKFNNNKRIPSESDHHKTRRHSLNFPNTPTTTISSQSRTTTSLLLKPPSSSRPMDLDHDFSSLPFDVISKIAASFTLPDLRSASMVCRSWRAGLRPPREAILFVSWGKKFKHGRGGVRPNLIKALDSFLKGVVRGSTLAMVDAGLIYWEMGRRDEGIALYKRVAIFQF